MSSVMGPILAVSANQFGTRLSPVGQPLIQTHKELKTQMNKKINSRLYTTSKLNQTQRADKLIELLKENLNNNFAIDTLKEFLEENKGLEVKVLTKLSEGNHTAILETIGQSVDLLPVLIQSKNSELTTTVTKHINAQYTHEQQAAISKGLEVVPASRTTVTHTKGDGLCWARAIS